MLISVLFIVVVFCYTIIALHSHGKLKWRNDKDWFSFFGNLSHWRKYKNPMEMAPDKWYYRFFKIPYKERFPGSATIFVWLTDGYHLTQFIMITVLMVILSILMNSWLVFFVGRFLWWVVFNLTYKFLSK